VLVLLSKPNDTMRDAVLEVLLDCQLGLIILLFTHAPKLPSTTQPI
jgi:hypothetical protein